VSSCSVLHAVLTFLLLQAFIALRGSPSDYFQRVWDIFLSENMHDFLLSLSHTDVPAPGMVFLLRVGLAIVTCCHHTPLGVHQDTEALEHPYAPTAVLDLLN
jgi:hypothetical protein